MKRILLSTVFLILFFPGALTIQAQSWVPVGPIGFSAGSANDISFAFSPSGEPYVAYQDYPNSQKATVKKFDGSNWLTVGSSGFSEGSATYISLAFSSSGEPYIAYSDGANGAGVTMMKYDGNSWGNVGSPGFSVGSSGYTEPAMYISLASSNNSLYSTLPIVAYTNGGNSNKENIMMYEPMSPTSWTHLGYAGTALGTAFYISAKYSPNGIPYVAYKDNGNSGKATVTKLDGINWVTVGSAGISSGEIMYTSLAFSPSGEPYLAYQDNSGKATVMKFDGSNWVTVGATSFSEGQADYVSLAFNPISGDPYVAYTDGYYSGRVTVKKFDGGNWLTVGSPGFTTGTSIYTSLAFNPAGEPYVAYKDTGGGVAVMKFDETTTNISEVINQTKINVHPNPTNDRINFTLQSNAQLINIAGQVVTNKTNVNSLDMSYLPDGVYFLILKSGNGQVIQRSKVIRR